MKVKDLVNNVFCSLSLIFVLFPHFFANFSVFLKKYPNFEEVLKFRKQCIKRDLGKIWIFQKIYIHGCSINNKYIGFRNDWE